MNSNESSVLIYGETILYPIVIYLFKVNKKISRKWCEISTKFSKNLPKRGGLQDIFDLHSHSSICGESDFSGNDAGSDVEL